MQLTITNVKGTWDITELVPTVRWSGDYRQAARSLDFTLLSSPTDTSIPVVKAPLGAGVQLLLPSADGQQFAVICRLM